MIFQAFWNWIARSHRKEDLVGVTPYHDRFVPIRKLA